RSIDRPKTAPTYVSFREQSWFSPALIQAAINQRAVFKPGKLLSPSATPYRKSTQKIPRVV
ncbi:MAG TPA: hypothetical protein VJ372_11480, partial [Pyrinomonadaceae bacterium]|nr:hypothetical protein [Pyrinomonadaceae bacterium]